MNIHIPYLDAWLIFCAAVFPTGLGANIGVLLQKYKQRSLLYSLLGMLFAYAVIAGLLFAEYPAVFENSFIIHIGYLILAVVCAGACYAVEFLVGAFVFFMKCGRFPKRFTVHNAYSGYQKIKWTDYTAVAVYVIMEELILRVVMYNVLRILGIHNVFLLIAIMSVVYAVNHVSFGATALLQKLFSGCIFSCLYVFTGESVVYPIIAHGIYNISLVIFSQRKRGNNGT